MTRSKFYVDGVAVDTGGYRWVRADQKMHAPASVTMAQVSIPGMDGELSLPNTHRFGAADWSLSVAFYGNTYEQMFDRKTAFEALLTQKNTELAITEEMPSGKRLTAYCYLTSADAGSPWDGPEDYLEVTYTFRIPSGVWLGNEVTWNVPGAGTYTVPSSLLGGSAPMYETQIQITGGNADFLIQAVGDPTAFIGFKGSTNGITTIYPKRAVSSYASSPVGIINSTNLMTGTKVFYIPASGQFYIPRAIGVGSIQITARKAYH